MRAHRLARRTAIAVVGGLLVVVGAVLMVLPGPGLIVVLMGVVVLSQEFAWARRVYEPVRYRAVQAAESSVATKLRIAGSTTAGLALVAAGVLWIVEPRLPFGGVSTGSSVILSGLLLLALLVYSYRRIHHSPTSRLTGRR